MTYNTISTTNGNVNIDLVNAVRSICGNRNNNNNSPTSTTNPLNTDQEANETKRVLNNYNLDDSTFGSNLINLPLEQLYKSTNTSGNNNNNNSLMLIHQNITLPNLNINQTTNSAAIALNGNFSNFGYNLGDKNL